MVVTERRTRMVSVRFTEAEYEHLCWLRDNRDDESVSEVLRSLAAESTATASIKRGSATDSHHLSEQRLEALCNWLTAKDSREDFPFRAAANGDANAKAKAQGNGK